MTHSSEADLNGYLSATSDAEDRAMVEQHTGECSECRERLAALSEIDLAFRDQSVWQEADRLSFRSPRVDEVLRVKARIERENAHAAKRLEALLISPLRFEDANIVGDARFINAGVARTLCTNANALHDRWPKFSLQLACAAFDIARKLENVPISSKRLLAAVALRENANALRYLGSFREALRALDDAEKLFAFPADAATAPLDLAIVAYIRGTILVQLDESTAKALALAADAVRVFREYADGPRTLGALLLQGVALLSLNRCPEALAVFDDVILQAREQQQNDRLAYGFQNSALAHVALGQLDQAERQFAEAFALYDELGVESEMARIEWALASIPVARGELQKGASMLEAARLNLLELGLRNDYALATLEWVEVMLALGQPKHVEAACRAILVEFESEGMKRNARFALAHLHEALARHRATPDLVRQVRTYLQRLPRRPTTPFTPAT
jgi:tetratricopeptide (TPR) repeat protein